jgi:23S rRNA pseudouridine2605 synthase
MSDDARDDKEKLLHWIQTHAGVSRRKAMELITAGEVTVDGRTVTEPSTLIRSGRIRSIALRGHLLPIESPELRIYRYHKPRDVLCSHDDPHDGNTVGRVLRSEGFIGYTWAGRLDRDAEGLLVLTNDGGLVHAFTHPRFEVRKSYRVWTEPSPKPQEMEAAFRGMRSGILDEGEELRILEGRVAGRPLYAEVTLAEGKKHEVKRLFASAGYRVTRLLRIRVGPIPLGNLPRGAFERLSPGQERAALAFARSRVARR